MTSKYTLTGLHGTPEMEPARAIKFPDYTVLMQGELYNIDEELEMKLVAKGLIEDDHTGPVMYGCLEDEWKQLEDDDEFLGVTMHHYTGPDSLTVDPLDLYTFSTVEDSLSNIHRDVDVLWGP